MLAKRSRSTPTRQAMPAAGPPVGRPRRVPLDRPAQLEEDEPLAGAAGDLGRLLDERGDRLGADVEVAVELAAGDAGQVVSVHVRAAHEPAVAEDTLELLAGGRPHAGAVDSRRGSAREAVLAEAETEQVPGTCSELDEVALVVVAVLEPVEVQRLGEDRLDLVARDVGYEGPDVRADIGARRAEVGGVAIAERVLGRAVGVLVRAVEVEEHRPSVDGEATLRRLPAGLAQDVLAGARVDARLDPESLVERRVGRKIELAPVQQVHLPHRIVREDIAGGVIGERRRDAVDPGPLLKVREDRVDALTGEVARKGERRGLQIIRPGPGRHGPTLDDSGRSVRA